MYAVRCMEVPWGWLGISIWVALLCARAIGGEWGRLLITVYCGAIFGFVLWSLDVSREYILVILPAFVALPYLNWVRRD